MKRNEALKIVKERRSLQKERKKIADKLWKGKLSLSERASYQTKLKDIDSKIEVQYPMYIEAFKLFFVAN